ncbi:MAG TPA: uracil-DNA glycosylase [Flavobacteriaceae bacterium]|nr:uracil-DNA glycosylase [Flavobacteriaceae bacterium]HIP26171.1 uracil-DNA glycosylase [Flavobacteriaceae bacterium]
MDLNIEKGWKDILSQELEKPYFKELIQFVDTEYQATVCYPKKNEIFNAFNTCAFENLKVVIIGQDPYHGIGQANGLCFSVNNTITIPPSLKNIFKELHTDINKPISQNGNLISWAKQGVLLLNATLTVRANEAGSHQKKGWEQFTDAVIKKISDNKKDIVFLLWGGFAKKKGTKIDKTKHYILLSGHPSPLSANRGYWFGNKHFSKTNNFLKMKNKTEINW